MPHVMQNFAKNLKFRVFTFIKLPSLWFWNVRVLECDEALCNTAIRYSWFTKNPFNSIYFSTLFGAAELSTGLLVQRKANEKKNISMLVIRSEAEFTNKASGRIIFTCTEGNLVGEVFERLIHSGDQATLVLRSEGKNESGQVIGQFSFTWSLKKR